MDEPDAADYEAGVRVGDVDDPIPALLEVRDSHGNRVDLADARAVIDLDRESLIASRNQAFQAEAVDQWDCLDR